MGENFRVVSRRKKIQKNKKAATLSYTADKNLGRKKKTSYAHVRSSPSEGQGLISKIMSCRFFSM